MGNSKSNRNDTDTEAPSQHTCSHFSASLFWDERIQLRQINKPTKIFSLLFIFSLCQRAIICIFRSHESKITIFVFNILIDCQYSSFPLPTFFYPSVEMSLFEIKEKDKKVLQVESRRQKRLFTSIKSSKAQNSKAWISQ